MSPWGGHSKPKKERIEFGKAAGYEIVANGYALSGPKYYAAFRDVCMDMIHKYDVNQFKFDGTGNVNSVFPVASTAISPRQSTSSASFAQPRLGHLPQPHHWDVAFTLLAD